MKTEERERTTLKAGDRIIFHEEGTVSFHRQSGSLHLGVSDDDKFFLGEVVVKNETLVSGITGLIAQSHGLNIIKKEGFSPDHLVFDFVKG